MVGYRRRRATLGGAGKRRGAGAPGRLRAAKDQFESLDSALFRQGRVATNPFERLGTGPFVCRSALKLVEMDALCGLATATAAAEPRPAASSEFTFVDVCGGPGGFSEFLCTKGRGWGITLKEAANDCDWKIDRVVTSAAYFLLNGCFLPLFHQKQVHFEGFWLKRAAIFCENGSGQQAEVVESRFTVSYGSDGTGNVYRTENIRHFAAQVAASVPGGVRLVVADGGFQEARDSHDQESIMHRLVLAQVAAMSTVLGEGGAFVLKLFEVLTPCTASIYYVAHKLFRSVTLLKPVTSRPASSERYMVCRGFICEGSGKVSEHLLSLLQMAEDDSVGTMDDGSVRVGLAVPMGTMEADVAFMAHLRASNDALGARQLAACEAITSWARGKAGAGSDTGSGWCWGQDSVVLRREMLRRWGLAG